MRAHSIGWCFALDPSFKFFFSGSNDGKIYRVNILDNETTLLADFGKHMKILTLTFNKQEDVLWVGSTISEIIGLKGVSKVQKAEDLNTFSIAGLP